MTLAFPTRSGALVLSDPVIRQAQSRRCPPAEWAAVRPCLEPRRSTEAWLQIPWGRLQVHLLPLPRLRCRSPASSVHGAPAFLLLFHRSVPPPLFLQSSAPMFTTELSTLLLGLLGSVGIASTQTCPLEKNLFRFASPKGLAPNLACVYVCVCMHTCVCTHRRIMPSPAAAAAANLWS